MPDPRIWPIVNPAVSFFAVRNTSQIVLALNEARGDADFTNTSSDRIYLARGEDAVVGSGLPLLPGGSYHIGTDNLYTGAIYAISDCDEQETSNLAISEGDAA